MRFTNLIFAFIIIIFTFGGIITKFIDRDILHDLRQFRLYSNAIKEQNYRTDIIKYVLIHSTIMCSIFFFGKYNLYFITN